MQDVFPSPPSLFFDVHTSGGFRVSDTLPSVSLQADAIRAKLAAQGRTFLEGAGTPTLLITADQVRLLFFPLSQWSSC